MNVTTAETLAAITPMLATPGRPDDLARVAGTHVFERKLDGIRGLLSWDGHTVSIRNRNGRDITDRYPELELAARSLDAPLIIDGEIMAESGRFEDVAWRDKQKGLGWDKVPVRFVAFDVLYLPEVGDVRHQPYAYRRQALDSLALAGKFEVVEASTDPAFFDRVRAEGGEGVIAKHVNARYLSGRHPAWLKVKSLHTVTALVTGYETGKGSRAEMGAVKLAVLAQHPNNEWYLQEIGRAGSGFSQRTAMEMKHLLDGIAAAGPTLDSIPVVEVECLGATRSGVLRQPTFKGFRTDLDYTAATYAQVAALPRS